jgi:single-stranded-DNA-specific exonuclease
MAVLARALERAGRAAQLRVVGRGENPWSNAIRAELAGEDVGGLIVTDLGVRECALKHGTPTVVIDHHVPTGTPGDAVVISGHGLEPEPTSALLAYWCAGVLAPVNDLVWIAGLGLIGDMAEAAGFPEMTEAQAFGKTALREAVSLLNAPRRAAAADAGPSLSLLLKANGPKEITSGVHPETEQLRAAKAEVAAELDRVKRAAPKVRGEVALIRFHSPCQIHPLVAQQWRGRLKDKVVLAANTGYRPGWVHFAARTGEPDRDLIAFLVERRPPGADENYGSGHKQATGGALRLPDWNAFVQDLGFPEEIISERAAA